MTRAAVSEVVDLAQQLIRQPTVNPPGNEGDLAETLAPRLRIAGFTVELLDLGMGRASLLARRRGTARREPVASSGNLDTVPVGEASWVADPFGGSVVDGRLFGRGAADMKGGVAAMVVAACRLAAEPLEGELFVALSADEERGARGLSNFSGIRTFRRTGG